MVDTTAPRGTEVRGAAAVGFLQAYRRCVHDIPANERDRYYADIQPGARLYGVTSPPASERELDAVFERMRLQLEPSDACFACWGAPPAG